MTHRRAVAVAGGADARRDRRLCTLVVPGPVASCVPGRRRRKDSAVGALPASVKITVDGWPGAEGCGVPCGCPATRRSPLYPCRPIILHFQTQLGP